MRVFINYRREDTAGEARLLYERLAARYGTDDVFFDVEQQPGIDWLRELRSSGSRAGAFLALIGPGWLKCLQARRAAGASDPVEDFGRREIEWALRDWPGVIVPVLIDTTMPETVVLPRSIRGLCRKQAVQVRQGSFDRDAAALIGYLETVAATGPGRADVALPDADDRLGRPSPPDPPATATARASADVPAPRERHYDDVVDALLEGTVVPVLGSAVRGALPDANLLATHLARTFNIERGSQDLAEIAQYVAVTRGERRLYAALKEVLAGEPEPSAVHRFLAELTGQLRATGVTARPLMIVSASYDRALERAFEEANEPFDYVVYSPSGGWFVHFPWGENDAYPLAVTIKEPQKYADFPIDDDGEVQRTVIVKVHGAADGHEGPFKWVNNYVVTEDQYIDYLPTDNIHKLVPFQILDKLKSSRCLFLGYEMRDWNARVFLRRIWQGESISEKSWAIETAPDDLEKDSWGLVGHVELLAAPLPEYVATLREHLAAVAAGHV